MARNSRNQSTRQAANAAISNTVKKGRRPPPENETKAERFRRLAQPRMGRALYGIRLLANLAADSYDYTEAELTRMREELQKTEIAVFNRLEDRLRRKSAGSGRGVGPPHFEF